MPRECFYTRSKLARENYAVSDRFDRRKSPWIVPRADAGGKRVSIARFYVFSKKKKSRSKKYNRNGATPEPFGFGKTPAAIIRFRFPDGAAHRTRVWSSSARADNAVQIPLLTLHRFQGTEISLRKRPSAKWSLWCTRWSASRWCWCTCRASADCWRGAPAEYLPGSVFIVYLFDAIYFCLFDWKCWRRNRRHRRKKKNSSLDRGSILPFSTNRRRCEPSTSRATVVYSCRRVSSVCVCVWLVFLTRAKAERDWGEVVLLVINY